MSNPLREVQQYGQSLWYDNIRRSLISSGELKRLIDEDGLRGVTSNPSIFEKAIAGSTDYDAALKESEGRQDRDAKSLYELLAIADIQAAADVMRPVYEQTQRRDGYVSMEVSPYLARDTEGTLAEARRLWQALARPNVMIKVPATREGIPAIRQLISEGINVNVTLLFAVPTYEAVAQAYFEGLEALVAAGGDPSGVASVASFFVSRIDAAVDAELEARAREAADPARQEALRALEGRTAIANAKVAYSRYQKILRSDRWQALAAKGAQTQRLLWASTSTKNPAFRDTLYVEALIGPDTVDTVPTATFDAFRDHGQPRASLEEGRDDARRSLAAVEEAGVSLTAVTERLLHEGVTLFAEAFDKLLAAVEQKRAALLGDELNRQSFRLPEDLAAAVQAALEDWRVNGKVRRLWAMDKTLWTGDDENQWMGWLGVAEDQRAHAEPFVRLADEVKQAGFRHAVVLGMGGSSLFPEVVALTYATGEGFPTLHILDSTDPQQIRTLEGKLDLARTLFFVSSKSGSTLEPNIYYQYFRQRVEETVGAAEAGSRFVAITDPGSHLQKVAEEQGFRATYFGLKSIGGRYSALSNFGIVPAAAKGIDVADYFDRAEEMVHSCAASVPPAENPGVVLGAIMGVLHNHGRDKVTIIASPGIWDFGAWLEQLLAESTGKQGEGLIPVDRERLGPPEVYGNDRLFAYLRLDGGADPQQDAAVDALEAAGQPVVRMALRDPWELGEEVFRWEIATAVAGSIIGINPFNQPDVEAAKVEARKLTDQYERDGSLPAESPILEDRGIRLYADERNAGDLRAVAQTFQSASPLVAFLRAHLGRLRAGDYFCALAYVEMNAAHEETLQALRHAVRDRKRVATCLGFGPRFQHSTGQAYKGGPNSGVFLQITADDRADLPVPGQKYTFGVVKAAQARGDLQVLNDRGRRALRAHLGPDVAAGLATLRAAIDEALKA